MPKKKKMTGEEGMRVVLAWAWRLYNKTAGYLTKSEREELGRALDALESYRKGA